MSRESRRADSRRNLPNCPEPRPTDEQKPGGRDVYSPGGSKGDLFSIFIFIHFVKFFVCTIITTSHMSVTYLSSHTHIAGRKCMQPRRRSLALVPAAAVGALVACALALVLALKRSRPPPEMATAAAAALALPPIGLGTFGLSPAKAGPAVRSALAAGCHVKTVT